MLRRVLSHPLFYIVLLGACVALFFGARSVKGGAWLGVWTADKQRAPSVYQQKSFVDDSVIGVTMLHLELTQQSSARNVSFVQAVNVLQKSNTILSDNVITYLQGSANKQLALITYTKNIDKVLNDSETALSNLQVDHDDASQEYQQCLSDKSAADNQFFQGVNVFDGGLIQQGYDDALKSGACEATARISANASQAIIVKIEGYTTALKQLDTLLTTNEDLIVANVDLFKDNYLERIIQIRDQLSSLTNRAALD